MRIQGNTALILGSSNNPSVLLLLSIENKFNQGELRWISSERQFADRTKAQTRGLLAYRLRYGKVKFVYDPQYVAAKKKTAQDREAYVQRALFAVMMMTLNKTALGDGEVMIYEDVTEVVPAEHMGTKVGMDFIHPTGWYLFAFMAALVMLFGMFLGYMCGIHTNKRQRLALQGKVAELQQEEAQKWQDKWSSENSELAKKLQEVIHLHIAHNKAKREWQEYLSIAKVDLQQAEHALEELQSAPALLNRARREIEHHLLECPLAQRAGVFLAQRSQVWHLQHDCHGLSNARQVEAKRPCVWCAVIPPPFEEINGITGTSLLDDLRTFEQDHGTVSYESFHAG